jgi:phage gp29-like protein
MCYWPWAFRKAAKFWVSWLERYGGDFLIGKQPRVLGTQAETEAAYSDMADKLYAMLQDSIAVVPDDGSVEVLASSSKGGSSDAHERFLLYWRGEISIALLGTNQSTEQTSTLASATAALDVAADIRDGDARMIEADAQSLIDTEMARDDTPAQQAAMERLLEPIVSAFADGLTPEEIMGRMDDWYGMLDDSLMQDLLTRGIAAADALGRIEVAGEGGA